MKQLKKELIFMWGGEECAWVTLLTRKSLNVKVEQFNIFNKKYCLQFCFKIAESNDAEFHIKFFYINKQEFE